MTGSGRGEGRARTFTEQARRRQLVEVTVALIAELGYARCSLQRIADAAGVTKTAVLYHFTSKNAVIRAAYDHVITALTEHVGAAVEAAATPADAVDAYVSATIGHLAVHPTHVRMLIEALDDPDTTGAHDRADRPARWKPVADLLAAARDTGEYADDVDPRTLAIIVGGAIDGVVAERIADPAFDVEAAGSAILTLLPRR